MIDNTKEYIICAAIWYDDGIQEDDKDYKEKVKFPMHGKGRTFTNDNIKTGFVIGGFRHGNCIALRPSNPRFNEDMYTVQGFLTSTGRFVDRWQGMYLAWMAGQVDYKRAFKNIEEEGPDNFDCDALLKDIPSDNRHYETPFNMLYSEDLY